MYASTQLVVCFIYFLLIEPLFFKILLFYILLKHVPCSVSLIECGPVNTDFFMNLKRTELSDDGLEIDAYTRSLYEEYMQHCQSVFQNAAQDTDDIIQVTTFSTGIRSWEWMRFKEPNAYMSEKDFSLFIVATNSI